MGKRRLPYPFVPRSVDKVTSWEAYDIWCAARYRARDNYARFWQRYRVVLLASSDCWDPSIPEPVAVGPHPAGRVQLKKVVIPDDWNFADNALSAQE